MSPLAAGELRPRWPALPGRRPGTLAAVVLLHALLLLAWRQALRPEVQVAWVHRVLSEPVMWLRPVQAPPAPAVAPARSNEPRLPPAVGQPSGPAAPQRPLPPQPRPKESSIVRGAAPPPAPATATAALPAATVPQAAALPEIAAVATPPAPPASGPQPSGSSLLDSEATRQAVRQIARQPLLSERAAAATGEPFRTADGRLAEAAAQAGKGDCLKGEYFGGGAGLLSLPFLAAAVVRGQCAK